MGFGATARAQIQNNVTRAASPGKGSRYKTGFLALQPGEVVFTVLSSRGAISRSSRTWMAIHLYSRPSDGRRFHLFSKPSRFQRRPPC